MIFSGQVNARLVEVRFANSGKITKLNKSAGATVRKNELIASLDRKVFQAVLDRQLADYEKTRADFDYFNSVKNSPNEEINKYLKIEKQSVLNSSVKDVEIAKNNLDTCDLFSPVNGLIIDDSNVCEGVNITPAGSSFKIVDFQSLFLKCALSQKDLNEFKSPREVNITIEGLGQFVSTSSLPLTDGKNIYVKLPLTEISGALPGMIGQFEI